MTTPTDRPLLFGAATALLAAVMLSVLSLVNRTILDAHDLSWSDHALLFTDHLALTSMVLLLPMVVVGLAFVRGISRGFDLTPSAGIRRVEDLIFGAARDEKRRAIAIVWVAYAALLGVAHPLGDWVSSLVYDVLVHSLNPELAVSFIRTVGIALALLTTRILAMRGHSRAPLSGVYALFGLVAVITVQDLHYFSVVENHWLRVAILVIACFTISMSVVARTPVGMRTRMAAGLAAVVCACLAIFWSSYSATGVRHSTLTWDTSTGSALWRTFSVLGDRDGDGITGMLDAPDCAPDDPERGVNVPEVPANGIDDNCLGGEVAAPRALDLTRETPAMSAPPLNVLLVTIDTLRADHVGLSVNGRSITPALDGFSQHAFVFERAYSPSAHTNEAIPAVWRGTYPFDWHQGQLFWGGESSLGSIFSDLGYEAFATLALPRPALDTLSGFDDIDNELGVGPSGMVTGLATVERALERMDRRDPTRPFFAWVHLFDPHELHLESAALREWLGTGGYRTAYQHEVYAADAAFGTLIKGLLARKLSKNTIVAVFSDHGEALGDNGMRTHQFSGHDAVMRVPFMLRVPGVDAGTSSALASTIDLFPTVIEATGIEGIRPRHGVSMLNHMKGGPAPQREFVYFEANAQIPTFKGIATTEHKLLYDWHRQAYYLYDLTKDPGERRNLVSAQPERFEELRAQLWTFFDANYNASLLAQKLMRLDPEASREPTRYSGPPIERIPVAAPSP